MLMMLLLLLPDVIIITAACFTQQLLVLTTSCSVFSALYFIQLFGEFFHLELVEAVWRLRLLHARARR